MESQSAKDSERINGWYERWVSYSTQRAASRAGGGAAAVAFLAQGGAARLLVYHDLVLFSFGSIPRSLLRYWERAALFSYNTAAPLTEKLPSRRVTLSLKYPVCLQRGFFILHKISSPEFEKYLALAQIELIEPAWASNDQNQRMWVLQALYEISSPELEKYLTLAEADKSLVNFVARIRYCDGI